MSKKILTSILVFSFLIISSPTSLFMRTPLAQAQGLEGCVGGVGNCPPDGTAQQPRTIETLPPGYDTTSIFDIEDPIPLRSVEAPPGDDVVTNVIEGFIDLGVCSGESLAERIREEAPNVLAIAGGEGLRGLWNDFSGDILGDDEDQGVLADIVGGLNSVIGSDTALGIAGGAAPIVGPIAGGLLSGFFGGGGTALQNVIDEELRAKDACLDALAQVSARSVLQKVANGAINWTTGQPSENIPVGFVTNLNDTLQRAQDVAFGKFVLELKDDPFFQQSCKIFDLDIFHSLAQQHRASGGSTSFLSSADRYKLVAKTGKIEGNDCALAEIFNVDGDQGLSAEEAENYRKFREEGDLLVPNAGWEAFLTQLNDPGSNPYTVTARIESAYQNSQAEAREQESALINQGGGFLPDRRCPALVEVETVITEGGREGIETKEVVGWRFPRAEDGYRCPVERSDGTIEYEDPQIVTPSSSRREVVSQFIESDIRRIELADEFNEVIEDVADLFVTKLVARGLLGSSPTRYNTDIVIGEEEDLSGVIAVARRCWEDKADLYRPLVVLEYDISQLPEIGLIAFDYFQFVKNLYDFVQSSPSTFTPAVFGSLGELCYYATEEEESSSGFNRVCDFSALDIEAEQFGQFGQWKRDCSINDDVADGLKQRLEDKIKDLEGALTASRSASADIADAREKLNEINGFITELDESEDMTRARANELFNICQNYPRPETAYDGIFLQDIFTETENLLEIYFEQLDHHFTGGGADPVTCFEVVCDGEGPKECVSSD